MEENKHIEGIENSGGGASYRRPRMLLFLFLIVISFAILSVISDSWMENLTIKKIEVYGCELGSKIEIIKEVKDSVIHKKIMDIETINIMKLVSRNPYVKEVRVNALFNGEFQILLNERIPVCIYVNNDGYLAYCDSEGYTFPFKFDTRYNDLPILRGIENTDEFVATAKILNKIKTENNDNLDLISEIMPGRGKNTFEIISSDFGYRLILDDKSGLNEQLTKYYTFLSSSLCANDLYKIDYIDLRWEKRIVIGKAV